MGHGAGDTGVRAGSGHFSSIPEYCQMEIATFEEKRKSGGFPPAVEEGLLFRAIHRAEPGGVRRGRTCRWRGHVDADNGVAIEVYPSCIADFPWGTGAFPEIDRLESGFVARVRTVHGS